MARVIFGLILIAAAILQTAVLPGIGRVVVLPNLVVVLVLVITARRGAVEGLIWSLVGGMVLDVLALDAIGVNMLALSAVVLISSFARKRLFHSGILVPMLLAIVATFAYAIVLTAIRGIMGDGFSPPLAVLRLTFLQALLNALLVPPLYLLVGWLFRWEPERVTR